MILDMAPNAQVTKEKTDKFALKLKGFVLQTVPLKRQPMKWEKAFANHM